MTEPIQSTNVATQTAKTEPSITKRITYTLCTVPSSVFTFTKNLAEGKNIYDAGNAVKSDIKDVHDANKKQVKENADEIDKSTLKYSCIGFIIKYLNYLIN